MSVTEITNTRTNLIAWIEQLSDSNMLNFLDGLRNSTSNKDWWEDLTKSHISHINKGIDDAAKGRVMSSDEFWNALKNG